MVLTVVTLLYMPLNALFPLMILAHFEWPSEPGTAGAVGAIAAVN